MGPAFSAAIFLTGLSGLVAQVLLARELLVSFFGNELTLGIILANWLLSESAGVFLVGRAVERVRNKLSLFVILEVFFSLYLFLAIYLARTFKSIAGVGPEQAAGLTLIFYASLLVILPAAFSHGALFAAGCKLLQDRNPGRAIGRVYAWEISGTLCGSLILTFLLIPLWNSFQIVFSIALIDLAVCLFLKNSRYLKYLITALLGCLVLLAAGGFLERLQHSSLSRQRGLDLRVLDYRNSLYGNLTVTRRQGQYTFFYNGLPLVTAPVPDKQFVEDFGNLPLLFHPAPEEAFFISGGAGGLIDQALRHPLRRIDYTEPDPLIIRMLKRYPTPLTERELSDPRVNIQNSDARRFLLQNENKYDLILIGLSQPSDLSSNRHFSREFFALAKKRLKDGGILALRLPGSLVYLSRELAGLNSCVLNALKERYAYLRVIPGDYNIILASDSEGISSDGPAELLRRLSERGIKNTILLPGYLEYRLDPAKEKVFLKSLESLAVEKINSDLRPFALFEVLAIWNKQFSKKITSVYESFQTLDLKKTLLALSLLTLLLFIGLGRRSLAGGSLLYSIFSTGFFGMLASLVLIFSFQVLYGYLYRSLGLLIGLFMAGAACGSIFISHRLERTGRGINLFAGLEAAIVVFSCLLGLAITNFIEQNHCPLFVFLALFYICGLLLGLEFPLAAKIYLGGRNRAGEASGVLYGADLLGGWLAGMTGGIVLLPVLGIFNTCLLMALLKLSSMILFLGGNAGISSLKYLTKSMPGI